MDTYRDDEIIMVPVPKSRLADVYAALAKPAKEGADVPAEEKIEVPGQGSLTALMVGKLASELKIPAVRTLLTRLAEQAPESLTFKEAVRVTGIESNALRAQLGSLSKISKRLFSHTIWPMHVGYVDGGEAVYSMDPKIAAWWLEAASEKS